MSAEVDNDIGRADSVLSTSRHESFIMPPDDPVIASPAPQRRAIPVPTARPQSAALADRVAQLTSQVSSLEQEASRLDTENISRRDRLLSERSATYADHLRLARHDSELKEASAEQILEQYEILHNDFLDVSTERDDALRQLEEMRRDYKDVVRRMEQARSEVETWRTRARAAEKSANEAKADAKSAQESRQDAMNAASVLRRQVKELDSKASQLAAQLDAAKEAAESAEKREQRAKDRLRMAQVTPRGRNGSQSETDLCNALAEANGKIAQLEIDAEESRRAEAILRKLVAEVEQEADQVLKEAEDARNMAMGAETQMDSRFTQSRTLTCAISAAQGEFADATKEEVVASLVAERKATVKLLREAAQIHQQEELLNLEAFSKVGLSVLNAALEQVQGCMPISVLDLPPDITPTIIS